MVVVVVVAVGNLTTCRGLFLRTVRRGGSDVAACCSMAAASREIYIRVYVCMYVNIPIGRLYLY